jgi:cell division protein FtsB
MEKVSKPHNPAKIIFMMLMVTFLVLIFFFGSMILKTYRELQQFSEREARLVVKLKQAEKEFFQKETYLKRLQDPEFLERVARERLGYTKPDEVIFRFAPE